MPNSNSNPLFALGAYAKILRYGEHVLKVPRDDDPEFRDFCYRDLMHEKEIYAHLGHSEHIVDWFENDEGIEMACMEGNIDDYIRTQDQPPQTTLKKMIQQLVNALCYVHDKKVLVYDLFARNVLINSGGVGHGDVTLKLCDFGNSIKLPAHTDISNTIVEGVSDQVDIFNLGWIMYSLVKWEAHSYDLFIPRTHSDMHESDSAKESSMGINENDNDEPVWPQTLPNTANLLYGDVIYKCWTKHAYPNVHAVRDATM